jgi:hypothetical protein
MTRDEAVDLLMGRLARRSSLVTQQDIINEMAFVQSFILEGDPTPLWFLLTESAETTTLADDERLPVPSDFLQEWEEGSLYVSETSGGDLTSMVKDDWDTIKEKIKGSGKPEYYDISGDYFLLRKVPNDAYYITMRYYARAASLAGVYGDAANVENKWLEHAADLLIAEVGVIIANQYLQSKTMVELFLRQAGTAKDRLIRKDTIMKEVNKQRFMEG